MEFFLSIWNQQNTEDLESNLSSESWEKYFKTYKILNQQFKPGFLDISECENSSTGGKGCNILTKEWKLMQEYKNLFKNCNFDETLETPKHVPGIKLKPNFPRLSVMNGEQHAMYLDISKRLLMNQNTLSASTKNKILKLFELLDVKVQKERLMFSKFVEQEWNINQEKLNTMNSSLKAFVNTIWKLRLGCVKFYPRMYERQKTIPLTYQGNKELIKMLPMTEPLMSVGKDVEYSPLISKKQLFINTRHKKLCEMFPPYKNVNEILHIYGPAVSCDKRAEDLAVKNNVDIVISSSVLSLIACNTNSKFGKEWDIPVIVKEYQLKGKTGISKKIIVYVDKALPPRNMSAFDKRHFFYKLASKFRLCKRIYSQTARYPKETSKNIEDPVTHTNQADTLEVNNGISNSAMKNSFCSCSSPNVCSKINDSFDLHENESDDSDHLVIDYSEDDTESTFEVNNGLVKEITLLRSHDNSSSITLRSGSSYYNSENGSSMQQSMSPQTKKRKHLNEAKVNSNNYNIEGSLTSLNCCTCGKQLDNQDPFKKSTKSDHLTPGLSCNYENNNIFSQNLSNSSVGTNFLGGKLFQSEVSPDKKYVYHKWKISADRRRVEGGGLNILKSECGIRPLSLLIRSKVDGYKVVNNKQIPVQIFPKLEYQYQYGMEALTTSELYKQWATLYFKPKSILSRVRINAFTSEVLLTEEKSLDDLESLNRNMRPSILPTIYSLLLGLMDIGPGSYLLSHRNTMGPFVSLMSESKKEESFDLHKEYEVDVEHTENVSNWAWRPIDVNMQTPYHKSKKQVPGMFLPADHAHSPQTHGKLKRKKTFNK